MKLTKRLAVKVLKTVDAGLVAGIGEPEPGKMCVEAAVCYAMGLPHGDSPTCVSPALRSLKITLNDAAWSSPEARARGMRRLAVAQLGSAGALDDQEFVKRCARMAVMHSVSAALRSAATLFLVTSVHKQNLLDSAALCAREGTKEAARAGAAAAWAAGEAARAARDSSLSAFAEEVVKILVEMKAPGTRYLVLTEAA